MPSGIDQISSTEPTELLLDGHSRFGDRTLSNIGSKYYKMTKYLNTNVSNKIKNLDKNSAAFILQGAIDYLTN